MSALEKAWEPQTHSVTPVGISESGGGAEHPSPGRTPPFSVPTLLLAHREAANRGSRPATSAAPLEGGRVDADNERTSWGCSGAADSKASVGNKDIFRAESGSFFSPSL